MKNIAIIGFGFSGLLAFFHLVNKPNKNKILIFDKNGAEALGPAFSSFSEHYLLNVPVIKMSAFEKDQRHFYNFLAINYSKILQETGEFGFAPRFTYGKYLQEIKKLAFENAQKNSIEFEIITEEVTTITKNNFVQNNEFTIKTNSKNSYQASRILLATSFEQNKFLDKKIIANANCSKKIVIKNLWDGENCNFHKENFLQENNIKKILILGSSLTAVDVIVSLKKRNYTGEIFITSRRGNFPKQHFTTWQIIPNFIEAVDAKKGLLFLCLKIRNFLRKNPQYDLRHAVDSAREVAANLWHNFDDKNKKLFLRLMPYTISTNKNHTISLT